MHQTDRHYVHELDGVGYKMPIVFGCFTVSALALMGVPGLAGFISKLNIAEAAVESTDVWAYAGIGCLLLSALLTAIYMMTMSVRAFFPKKGFDYAVLEGVKDPNWKMLLPLGIFVVFIVFFGIKSDFITQFLVGVAEGIY